MPLVCLTAIVFAQAYVGVGYPGKLLVPGAPINSLEPIANVMPLAHAVPLDTAYPLIDVGALLKAGDPLPGAAESQRICRLAEQLIASSANALRPQFGYPDGRIAQAPADPTPGLTAAFQISLGRVPTAAERAGWLRVLNGNPRDQRVRSLASLQGTIMAILKLPESAALREGLVRRAFQDVLGRSPTRPEHEASNRHMLAAGETLRYIDLIRLLQGISMASVRASGAVPKASVYAWWIGQPYSNPSLRDGNRMAAFMLTALARDPASRSAKLTLAIEQAIGRAGITEARLRQWDAAAGAQDFPTLVKAIRDSK